MPPLARESPMTTSPTINKTYDTDDAARKAIGEWHIEMAQYIKEELQHNRHLLSANYTGKAPMDNYNDSPENPCESFNFDATWNSPYIDVICWNNYGIGANRFEDLSVDEYGNLDCVYVESNGETWYLPAGDFEIVQKPVMYGENGHGTGYMDCDHTGFLKDLVAIPFSGHANSGMSWDENTEQAHWHWMGKVSNFLETAFLDEIDLNNDDWVPGYVVSDDGFGESKAEAVYLRRTEENHKKLIGVIMNRTWNWYTIGEGGECDNIPATTTLEENLLTFEEVGSQLEPIRIPGMGFLNSYTIQYIDPATLIEINQETVVPFDGKLDLASFPLLTSTRPFVFFKAWRNEDGEQFYPEINDHLIVGVHRRKFEPMPVQNSFSFCNGKVQIVDYEFQVSPIPAHDKVRLQASTHSASQVAICNAMGEIVTNVSVSGSIVLDVANWAPGMYFVYDLERPQINTKFVKQ
ncbi:MAG: T9SS type A sorting domain-containing protein, partial [Flavobacteriales bacterium]|nr:T9SS type A sorting domain-containing protein [Flavobacteriales bacterium]